MGVAGELDLLSCVGMAICVQYSPSNVPVQFWRLSRRYFGPRQRLKEGESDE